VIDAVSSLLKIFGLILLPTSRQCITKTKKICNLLIFVFFFSLEDTDNFLHAVFLGNYKFRGFFVFIQNSSFLDFCVVYFFPCLL
jgi:hypothetical protein